MVLYETLMKHNRNKTEAFDTILDMVVVPCRR
jgi:hypothetical protein